MARPTNLLGDDGKASIATALLMSHHAFRRDLALFGRALKDFRAARGAALREEWAFFRNALHGHHEQEDTRMFPMFVANHPRLSAVIEQLGADHRRIDPLLERGDVAFGELEASTAGATAVVDELAALLVDHLEREEEVVVPILRNVGAFPPPSTDAEVELYAQGFAWSSHGVASEVLDRVGAILPPAVSAKLPEARATYAERCVRVWGSATTSASTTSIPDWLLR